MASNREFRELNRKLLKSEIHDAVTAVDPDTHGTELDSDHVSIVWQDGSRQDTTVNMARKAIEQSDNSESLWNTFRKL